MAVQIELRGLGGAPVRADLRKLAHDQRLDVRTPRLFIIQIRADISDVGIGEADNLAGVAGIGENFLISGKAGIKNDFAAAARDGAARAAVKDAPVFQGESGRAVLNFRQCDLLGSSLSIVPSFRFCFRSVRHGERAEVVHRPISEDRAAVDEAAGHGAEYARIVGADAVVTHNKVIVTRDADWTEVAQVFVLRRNVRLGEWVAVNVDDALANLHDFAGQANHTLDERFRAVQRVPEHDDVAALDGLKAIHKFVDEDALLVGKQGRHAGAFHLHRLIQKNDDDQRQADGDQQVASPDTDFGAEGMSGGMSRRRC